ncbi:MAG: hypothetical protein ACYC7D_10745 [Nitrososphaerales archaeon]
MALAGVALLALVIGFAFGSVAPQTAPESATLTRAVTVLSSITNGANSSARLYELVFNETGYCAPRAYLDP